MVDFDPGSFKDPCGRVFYHDNSVGRALTADAIEQFRAASQSGLISALTDASWLVPSTLVAVNDIGLPSETVGSHIIQQPRVPLVSYSYEWSFGMLRDAALVTLRVMSRALASGFILKDANSFNILFDGTTPKLVDVTSIERYRDGQLWAGYAQFCRSFLFPLLIAAYRDLDVQAILRGTLGELPVQEATKFLRLRDGLRAGVAKDVFLQARLERSFATSTTAVASSATRRAYPKELLVANVRRLMRLIERLPVPRRPTEWTSYDTFHSYSESDRRTKLAFVKRVARHSRWQRVVDLGCNTGEYSMAALETTPDVVALDLDARAIDRLYSRSAGTTGLSLLVANLLNPTPPLGWGLRERRSLLERITADGFLALALVHHLRITGGVPLADVVEQLAAIAPDGVVEWVDKDDSMVRQMLTLRPDVYDDYTWPNFATLIERSGQLIEVTPTHEGRRRLCHVRFDRPGRT